MNRDTEMLREWLGGALTGALISTGWPVSTMELADKAPWKRERIERRCNHQAFPHHTINQPSHVEVVECVPGWHIVNIKRSNHDVYRQLRAMEKKGLCTHQKVDGVCYWSPAVPEQAASEIADLERIWSL